MAKTFHYGGQALIEGVMMRGQKHLAIAVRLPDGGLGVTCQPLSHLYTGRLRELPFIRGIISLVETLTIGLRALFYSANVQTNQSKEMNKGALWGTLLLALVFAIALFFIAPLLLSRLFYSHISSALVSNLIEGAFRLVIFIIYLWAIGLSQEIRRVFAYHGAEHKAVNAYENGAPLEVERVRKYHTAHVRCGTSFLLAVLVLAIFIFALIGRPSLWVSVVSRVVLLPVIAGLGYEFIRLSADWAHHRLMRPLLIPGLALQSMTTREPDDGQLEVALSALRQVIQADNPPSGPYPSEAPVEMAQKPEAAPQPKNS